MKIITQDGSHILCDQCDLVVEISTMKHYGRANCPRCGNQLISSQSTTNRQALIYSGCALVMLFVGCAFHLIGISIMGNNNNITVFTIPYVLWSDNYISLSCLFTVFVLFFPLLCLLSLVILCSGMTISKRLTIILLAMISTLQYWCMAEIFLAGILVSFVKLTNYGDIGINISFLPYCFFILLQIKALSLFDASLIWQQVAARVHTSRFFQAGQTGMEQGIRLCRCCHAILGMEAIACPRCYKRGDVRVKQSLQWTLALLLTAIIFYIPANVLAVMQTLFLGGVAGSTILDGVLYMWNEGDYPISIIIFTASIVIPVLKIIALCWLCHFSVYSSDRNEKECFKMNKLYSLVEFIGRWSMIDIFVVAVTSTLIRHGEMISIYPDNGAIFFAIVVILTMLASKKYDPRLIWDRMKSKDY